MTFTVFVLTYSMSPSLTNAALLKCVLFISFWRRVGIVIVFLRIQFSGSCFVAVGILTKWRLVRKNVQKVGSTNTRNVQSYCLNTVIATYTLYIQIKILQISFTVYNVYKRYKLVYASFYVMSLVLYPIS